MVRAGKDMRGGEQPAGNAEPAAHALPPRDGLIPGTWKMVDPGRLGLIDRPRLPSVWSSRHVGNRLIEAYRVVARMPARIWPKQFGSAWPEVVREWGDAPRNSRSWNSRGAGADEIARCSQAISWPLQYLSHRPALARDVNLWASQITEEEFEKIDDGDLSIPWDGLQMIAACLNAAKEVVR
jgi:hypothetical protein